MLYGENGFLAFEFKSGARLRESDFHTLTLFGDDYLQAKRYLVHGGTERRSHKGIEVLPVRDFFAEAARLLMDGT